MDAFLEHENHQAEQPKVEKREVQKDEDEGVEKREMKVIKENDQEKEPVEVRNFMAFLRGEKRD